MQGLFNYAIYSERMLGGMLLKKMFDALNLNTTVFSSAHQTPSHQNNMTNSPPTNPEAPPETSLVDVSSQDGFSEDSTSVISA
jgi:hypothetical protein